MAKWGILPKDVETSKLTHLLSISVQSTRAYLEQLRNGKNLYTIVIGAPILGNRRRGMVGVSML